MQRATFRRHGIVLISVFLVFASLAVTQYLKMNPPADVDKGAFTPAPPAVDNSCWQATASNMLAGAGYGTGATLQARANQIYSQVVANFGVDGGWADTALSWWLGSTHNTWTNNRYTVVTVYGNKIPKYPWADTNGARSIGNHLRDCNFVGLSISWPDNTPGVIGSDGHAITGWGDGSAPQTLTANPANVRLTDSDRDTGGNVQTYTYDAFTNPNPGGANEGNGWYLNYSANHPYIKHIVVLSPATTSSGGKLTQRVTGSYQIHQAQSKAATDLHYKVGTDVDILSYNTTIDWPTTTSPTITEDSPRRHLTVDWDLSSNPVPYCTLVTITTEFILPSWNSIQYDGPAFTYPDAGQTFPRIRWEMKTPRVERAAKIPNVTGGYVIGSFDVVNPRLPVKERPVARYRFIHEYSFNQSPEQHVFLLSGVKGLTAANVRFGHSYGYLDPRALWKFEAWMTKLEKPYPLTDRPAEIRIDWKGRLPYPPGEDIRGHIRDIKEGPPGKTVK
jgi:hypothetical protein